MSERTGYVVFFGVWALCAFVYGLTCENDAKDKNGVPYAGAIFFGLWPIFAFFAAILSPLWVPVVISNIGAEIREWRERKKSVRDVLNQVGMGGKD